VCASYVDKKNDLLCACHEEAMEIANENLDIGERTGRNGLEKIQIAMTGGPMIDQSRAAVWPRRRKCGAAFSSGGVFTGSTKGLRKTRFVIADPAQAFASKVDIRCPKPIQPNVSRPASICCSNQC
jgi:hypothetical protein